MKRMLAVFFALLFALSACSMNHQRRIEPLDGAQVSEIEQKINYGAPTENGLSQFYLRYHWNGTPQSIFAWFEIYENGKMTEKGKRPTPMPSAIRACCSFPPMGRDRSGGQSIL